MRLDHIPGANDYRALDDIFQLADVAGPTMPFQRAYGVRRETEVLPSLTFCVPLDEVVRKDRNVTLSLAQGRQLEPGHVQAVEQIRAKAIFRNRGLQRAIRARDNPGLERALFRSAETAKAPVFNDAKKLRL